MASRRFEKPTNQLVGFVIFTCEKILNIIKLVQ